jgi:hypothetical protein
MPLLACVLLRLLLLLIRFFPCRRPVSPRPSGRGVREGPAARVGDERSVDGDSKTASSAAVVVGLARDWSCSTASCACQCTERCAAGSRVQASSALHPCSHDVRSCCSHHRPADRDRRESAVYSSAELDDAGRSGCSSHDERDHRHDEIACAHAEVPTPVTSLRSLLSSRSSCRPRETCQHGARLHHHSGRRRFTSEG